MMTDVGPFSGVDEEKRLIGTEWSRANRRTGHSLLEACGNVTVVESGETNGLSGCVDTPENSVVRVV